MIDKSTVDRLVIQSGGRLKEIIPFEFQGIIYHPSESYYFDSSTQLRKFTQAVIEEYKASLVPVAWMQRQGDYFENEQDEYHSVPLYDLGETK